MRKVDRFVGVPLCLAATLVEKLRRALGRAPKPQASPRRILFIELAEFGGLVVAYPSLAHAKRLFPEAELYFLTFAGGKGILDLMGAIPLQNQLIIRPEGLVTFLKDTIKAVFALRRLGLDAVVNLETFARFSTLLAWASGAPTRVGFHPYFEEGHYLGDLVTHRVIYSPHAHAARTFITLVEALQDPPGREPKVKRNVNQAPLAVPKVASGPAERANIENKLKELHPGLGPEHRLVILNPNSSDLITIRRWPEDNFVALGKALLQDPRVLLVLTGTPAERPQAVKIAQRFGGDRVLNMAGRTTLAELVHLYNRCHLLVTNDSGPAHFASLSNMPVLVLFGPEKPGVYGPLGDNIEIVYLDFACSPCVSAYNAKRSPCTDGQCVKQISPELILAKAKEKLGI